MDSNIASIHIKNFEEVFTAFHGISTEYAIEILGIKDYEVMNQELDRAFGLSFLKTEGPNYIFRVEDKNKYLMAKILYGA